MILPRNKFLPIPAWSYFDVQATFNVDPETGVVSVSFIGVEIAGRYKIRSAFTYLKEYLDGQANYDMESDCWIARRQSLYRCHVCKSRNNVERDTLGLPVCEKHGGNMDANREEYER